MAIDLVPNNRDFRVDGWHYLSEEENETILISELDSDGNVKIVGKRSDLGFPPTVFTLTEKQWRPFWEWVCQNNSKKGGIFSREELIAGQNSAGLYVSSLQCALLAVDLDAAIRTNTPIRATRPPRTVAFIQEGDTKLPVVGWAGEYPIVEREGGQVAVVELDIETKEPKVPTIYEEIVPETVTTHEDGRQTVGDTEGGVWYYWAFPGYMAVALVEFIRKSNGFTIL